MARITLQMPDHFDFCTELQVRVTDLNYGNHLGNDALVSLIHEARVQFLVSHGFTEFDIAGCGILMTDLAVVYKAETFYGETLRFSVVIADIQRVGCDIVYRIENAATGTLVAVAKTGIVFVEPQTRKVCPIPKVFRALSAPN